MLHQRLLLAVVAVSCFIACHAQFWELLGGLALLKGAAIVGYKFGRSSRGSYSHGRRPYYRYRRAIQTDLIREANETLTAVMQHDPEGCLLKLLCLAYATPEQTRTPYQVAMVHLFADIAQAPTLTRTPFIQAVQVGDSSGKAEVACHEKYASCPLSGAALHGMLVQAWGTNENQPPTAYT